MIKKGVIILALFALILFSFNVLAVSTMSTPSVCCEKTTEGAYCINTDQDKCDSTGQIVSTSCESTSFCKLGTCYDSKEGMCLENVPQRVCQASNGTWSEKKANELAQCTLGCCIMADQAAFVTLTRCKSLSTFFGITPDFRSSVGSEQACIEIANSQDQGACVFYQNNVKTCKFSTRKDCGGVTSTVALNATPLEDTSGKRFYKDVLCSNEALGTECARQTKTSCFAGKVYWLDSCGNKENVYSSNSDKSWNQGRVADPDEICAEVGDSKTCGNCDYLLGSRCSDWTSGFSLITKPAKVTNYCKTTKCTDRDGKDRMNGESWCVYDGKTGDGRDVAGSRQFREICVDGTVQVEACEDFRNQICIHSGIQTSQGEYSVAACRVNRWQDCTSQTKKDNCENTDQRDCIWVAPVDGINFTTGGVGSSASSQQVSSPSSIVPGATSASDLDKGLGVVSAGTSLVNAFAIKHTVGSGVSQQWAENELDNRLRTNRTENDSGLCVPMVPPGTKFWESGDAQAVCSQATAECSVKVTRSYKKDIITGKEKLDKTEVEENDCLELVDKKSATFEVDPNWGMKANAICSAMGDCGADLNINGKFTDDGYEWKYDNQSYFFTAGDLGLLTRGLGSGTAQVVAIDYIINNKYKLNQDSYVYVKQ